MAFRRPPVEFSCKVTIYSRRRRVKIHKVRHIKEHPWTYFNDIILIEEVNQLVLYLKSASLVQLNCKK